MKNILTFEEFLNEASNYGGLTPEQIKVYDEVVSISDSALAQMKSLVKKYGAKLVSVGRPVGGYNIQHPKNNTFSFLNIGVNNENFNRKDMIIGGMNISLTAPLDVHNNLPYKGEDNKALGLKYKEFFNLLTNFQFITKQGSEFLTTNAVDEYKTYLKEFMSNLEDNLDFLKKGGFLS